MKPDNGARLDLILDSLAGIPLFDELSDDELKILGKHMHFLEAGAGEMIFEEGEKGNYVCFVADGELAVIKDAKSGERAVITKLTRGDSVGEMAVIDHFPRSATVIATEDSNLVTLASDDFKKLLNNHPQVGISILKGIARVLSINLRKTSSQLADYMLPIM